jgi:hypothetical protein
MDTWLVYLHNILRWIILILLLASIINSFSKWQGKKSFTAGDGKLWLFTMLSGHITLLLGLYQVLLGRYGMINTTLPAGTNVMKDPFYRFFWVEHPVSMIIAIVLITLGRRSAKMQIADNAKFRRAFWFFLIALLLILAVIPWPFREGIGRPLIPGMN